MREAFFLRPPAQLVGFSTSQTSLCPSESNCESSGRCPQNMSNWTSLWYIWLILLTLFLLLLCGIAASCIRFCCQKKRLPVETFSRHPYDLTVIAIDSDSTAHSTVTSYSSWQYPLSAPIPSVFVDMDKNTVSLPAYSLYTMELPPSYDEAVQTGKQHIEVPQISQKCNDIPGQVTSGGMNPIQYSPGTSNRYPATQANSGNSEDATQEQLQLCHSFQMGSKGREGE
ncbi:transmembrane protein 52 [Ara ararauna]